MTISHKFLLAAAALLGLLLVATDTQAWESSSPQINTRVRSSDSGATNAPVPVPAVEDDEQRRLSEDNLRRQTEAAEKIRLEKEQRAAAIAAWEEYQVEQKKRKEKEQADREARNRAREGAPVGQCVYKAVMSDAELEACREARR